MPLHAIEIILTRTVRGVELKSAQRLSGMPMASSQDGKNIAVLVSARNEEQAIKKVWRRLEDALPIDVLCTLFPGPDGMLRMSIPFIPGVKRRIHSWARAAGKNTEEFLSDAIREALARDRSSSAAAQECALGFLLHSCAWLESPLDASNRIAVSRLPLPLENLIRRVSTSGARLTFADDSGPIAALISERELARLENRSADQACPGDEECHGIG
ncbi:MULTISPECIES: hypothetical protein [unclassified Streptomyces]|uniref:hypothetical protein n=1 Tax=unclassified Streptomyces TaxID=2593676 RepID=UPI0023659B99|nr:MULTISPECIES: hypothetical protein [unclassified Streptomyces]MDF3140401.1 hypothetical protein [Streptomyces sp. T21Q-yed]WDF38806.1 hypothetical protein PBV52_19390 [Streptomyces sp. T12]